MLRPMLVGIPANVGEVVVLPYANKDIAVLRFCTPAALHATPPFPDGAELG